MKKYLIYLVLFFSIFFIVNSKVLAATSWTVDIDTVNDFFITEEEVSQLEGFNQTYYNRVKTKINEIKDTYDYVAIYNPGNNSIDIYYWLKTKNFKVYFNFLNSNQYWNYVTLNVNYGTKKNGNYSFNYEQYRIDSSTINSSNISNFTKTLRNYSIVNNKFLDYRADNYKILFSSQDIYFTSNTTKIDNVYLKNSDDDTFGPLVEDQVLYNNMKNVYTPDYFELNEMIDCNNLGRIEINFDIPVRESFIWDLYNFDVEYVEKLEQPTIRYYYVRDGVEVILPFGENEDLLAEDINGKEIFHYFMKDVEWEIGSPEDADLIGYDYLKIVIDVEDYNNDLTLNLKSSHKMTLNTYTKEQALSGTNYTTVDLTGKYGIYLIPKIQSDTMSKIYLDGDFNIKLYEAFDSRVSMIDDNRTPLKEYKNYASNIYNYIYEYNRRYMLYFINKEYDNDNYYTEIKFDSNVFNYAIKEGPFDMPEITDPNTGETFQIIEDDSFEDIDSNQTFLNNLEKIDNKVLKEIFSNIYLLFKKGGLGSYLFIIIISSIIILIIKSMQK